MKKNLSFEQLMSLYNHIGEGERHFNSLELEYRKLASQWLLVALGAIGFVLSKENSMPLNVWVLVVAICIAASVGILVLWLLDMRVYHELLHAGFREGVLLENEYPEMLPQIRNNMVNSQDGGDIVKRVILFYFYSVLLLVMIANVAIWYTPSGVWLAAGINVLSIIILVVIYYNMTKGSARKFKTA